MADTREPQSLTRREYYWSHGLVWLFIGMVAWTALTEDAGWMRWFLFGAPVLMAVVCTVASILSERSPSSSTAAEQAAPTDGGRDAGS
jgi:hypothetical protein